MDSQLGEQVAEARKRKGLSQRDLANLMGRSESWVSQVERGVLPVERLAILQKLAQVLGVSMLSLRPETADDSTYASEVDSDLDDLRNAITGYSTIQALFDEHPAVDLDRLTVEADTAWQSALNTDFAPLAKLIPVLEMAARTKVTEPPDPIVLDLLARSYQAASAGFARQDEADAAWLCADRALRAAERSGTWQQIIAGHFRLAHTFMRLLRFDQAHLVTQNAIETISPLVTNDADDEVLSLYGALQLVLAALAGFGNDRTRAKEALDIAEQIADRVGEGRNDYDTEFSPTNVMIHRVSVAVDLGDAGEAIEVAGQIDARSLSPERQMRLLLDTARAYTQRRQVEEATKALLAAERLAPEHLRSHKVAHQTITDLTNQTGDAPAALAKLGQRIGVIS